MLLKLLYKYYSKHGWNTFVRILSLVLVRGNRKQEWLHLCGLEIGEGSELSCGISAFPEPYMVTIGKKVYVATDVVFMTHDGGAFLDESSSGVYGQANR